MCPLAYIKQIISQFENNAFNLYPDFIFLSPLVQVLVCLFLSLTKSTTIHTTWCSLALLECILWRKGLNGILLLTRRRHLLVADTRHGRDHRKSVLPGGSRLVLSAVSCSSSSWLLRVKWAPCVCVCVFALHLCRLCRNPLNVSSSQSKSWGEPAWPAEFRWVLLVLSHPRCSVCCYQFNLSVCVFTHVCTHMHVVMDGSANVRSSV